ncbi:WcaF family extracellular polysaccharide biosynthesis acetyltransferase [Planctomycetaceae bacterium AH-315-I19]|nr:WcaF family extracellular polysaccharide biosynthesis acetyltransferase [Planctomycetaceae bacterium AH-315-I19]
MTDGAPLRSEQDRMVSPYSRREKVLRVLWNYIGQNLMRTTFHNWYGLRNALLRAFGATIGEHVRIRPSVRIEQPWNLTIGDNSSLGDRTIVYCLGKITIGANVSVSQHAHLCAGTHDYTKPDLPLLRPPIVIQDNVWLATEVFVGPGLTVGEGAVVGARSGVMGDLEPWGVYVGTPAKRIKDRPRLTQSQPDTET